MTICEADILAVSPATETATCPQAPSDNGFVVVIPNSAWGEAQEYGSGQAFMLVREGDRSDPGPGGAVIARMDNYGSFGTNGGMHVATGLRKPIPGANVGVFIEPFQNVVGLFVTNPAVGSTRDLLAVFDRRDATYPLVVRNDGTVEHGKATSHRELTAHPSAPLTGVKTYCLKGLSGKRQLWVRFPTGSPGVIATEP